MRTTRAWQKVGYLSEPFYLINSNPHLIHSSTGSLKINSEVRVGPVLQSKHPYIFGVATATRIFYFRLDSWKEVTLQIHSIYFFIYIDHQLTKENNNHIHMETYAWVDAIAHHGAFRVATIPDYRIFPNISHDPVRIYIHRI